MLDFVNPIRPFKGSEIIVFVLGLILLTLVYLFIEKKRNGFKPNYLILGLCAGIFIYALINLLLTPSVKTFSFADRFNPETIYQGVFEVTTDRRIYYIFFAFLTMLLIYLLIDIFPKRIYFLRVLDIGFYVGLALTLVCLVYSYIVEADKYVEIITNFNQGIIKDYVYSVRSFWNNRSNYSMLLMLMTFYTILVHNNHKKWWWLYIIAAFLITNNLFTTSKTNIPISIVFIFAYLIARFILSFKHHKVRNIIVASIIILNIVAVIITFYMLYNYSPISENLHESIEGLKNTGEGTIKSREFIWSACVDILNNSSWVFGCGFGYFNDLLREYMAFNHHDNPTNMPHNYFLQVLGEGGIIYMAFIAFITILLIIYMVKLVKKHTNLVVLELLFIIAFVVHGLLEANGPLAHSLPSGEGLIYTYLIIVPIFSLYHEEKHPEINEEIIKEGTSYAKTKKKYITNPYSFVNIIYFVTTLPLILVVGPLFAYFGNNIPFYLLVVTIAFIALYLFLPYILHISYLSTSYVDKEYYSFSKFILRVFLPFFTNLALGITLSRLYMSLVSNEFGVMIFMMFLNCVIYFGSFIVIPRFRYNAECMFALTNNLNNIHLRIYSHLLIKEKTYASQP